MLQTYPGGKNGSGVYQKIINQMPPHRVYVEAFAGSGAVLRRKKAAGSSIAIDIDPAVCGELVDLEISGLKIVQADALVWLKNRLASNGLDGDTLIYLDPPYMRSVRSADHLIYQYEFEKEEQHKRLLEILSRLPCMVMLSGYESSLYSRMLAGWRTVQYNAQTRGGRTAVEWLWMNYPEPLELHDYTYLGEDFRERERIKRKRERWKSRLEKMDLLERQAIFSALDEIRKESSPGQHVISDEATW